LEHADLAVNKIILSQMNTYRIQANTGFLIFTPKTEKYALNKQRAILYDDWLLVYNPGGEEEIPIVTNSTSLQFKLENIQPYFVLVNTQSGLWTMDLSSSLAKSAPLKELMAKLKTFFGKEIE
ncbi:MAG TPA: hypothetical protein VJN02_07605, partial [Gammaproteobacteria bacterium]|nr:hypothetical protein [Gammaproteobacteria bacterium]